MRIIELFFYIVVILSFMAGFYFHEGLNEKVQYERDTCYELMNRQTFFNIDNKSDIIIIDNKVSDILNSYLSI